MNEEKIQTIYLKGKLYRLANPNSISSPLSPEIAWELKSTITGLPETGPSWRASGSDTFLCLGEEYQEGETLWVRFLHVGQNRYAWICVRFYGFHRHKVNRKYRLVQVRK